MSNQTSSPLQTPLGMEHCKQQELNTIPSPQGKKIMNVVGLTWINFYTKIQKSITVELSFF
jgi:hypothetical protein